MRSKVTFVTALLVVAIFMSGVWWVDSVDAKDQAAIVAAELSTIAHQLALQPDIAIDLSGVSGEYCFNAGLGEGGHMTHYAIDPANTKEDVIDFVNAESLVKAGLKIENLPSFSGKRGSMTPNQWYYLPAGEPEPHHGTKFSFPLMIRATNVK